VAGCFATATVFSQLINKRLCYVSLQCHRAMRSVNGFLWSLVCCRSSLLQTVTRFVHTEICGHVSIAAHRVVIWEYNVGSMR